MSVVHTAPTPGLTDEERAVPYKAALESWARKELKKKREALWNNAVEDFQQVRIARVSKTLSLPWKEGRPLASSLDLDVKKLGDSTQIQEGTEDVAKVEEVLSHSVRS